VRLPSHAVLLTDPLLLTTGRGVARVFEQD